MSQQVPFYFLKSIPATIKLSGGIDLSFFRNQSIVSQYRYRLEIPDGAETAIDRRLTRWSPWISFNFNEIIIPVLDQEGGYKFLIEYKTTGNSEISKFEKLFYVYRYNPGIALEIARTKTTPLADGTAAKKPTEIDKKTTVAQPVPEKVEPKPAPVTNKDAPKKASVFEKPVERKTPVIEKITIESNSFSILPGEPANEPPSDANTTKVDYNRLLSEAIEKKDLAMIMKSIQHGAGSEIKGANGGNIFHLMGGTTANEELISMLKKKGISINEPDNFGNSPLHVAILSGDSEYARSLMNQGADLNIKNGLELAPLHLAAIMNNEKVANNLLIKGADINMKGKSGYTALHIASEMNHISLAKDLLYMGAKNRIKTDQKLTPGAIAKIQNNHEMNKLIAKKGSYTVDMSGSASKNSVILPDSPQLNPKYDFILPYNRELAEKRQLNKVFQFISVPIFALSTAGLTFMKSDANHYFSLSKIAETEEMAKAFYNKGNRYDTYAYISGGVALVSVYGFIHSTIRKKNISKKMYKEFY